MRGSDSNRWKRDTALCFIVLILMFLFVGLVFGLIIDQVFDTGPGFTMECIGFMFIVSLIALVACYASVEKTPDKIKGWIELSRSDNESLFACVDAMCDNLGIPTPRIYVSQDRFPNAFAIGRSPENAHICMTIGLLETVNGDELAAVLGHELSHIAHMDTLVKGIAQNCTSALTSSSMLIGLISLMFLGSFDSKGNRSGSSAGPFVLILMIIAVVMALFALVMVVTIPGACVITKGVVSRNREFLADEGSARITGNPLALASALRKMEEVCVNGTAHIKAVDAMKWTVDPNCAKGRGIMNRITSTHPSTEERIRRLEMLAKELEEEEEPLMIERR